MLLWNVHCATFGASSMLECICAEAFLFTKLQSSAIPDNVVELDDPCFVGLVISRLHLAHYLSLNTSVLMPLLMQTVLFSADTSHLWEHRLSVSTSNPCIFEGTRPG